jgi:tetratricopeptide (TPR) repeat protein
MGNPLARFGRWGKRQWVIAAAVVFVAVAAALLLAPNLWAWYHYRAGVSASERYHSADAQAHFNSCLKIWKQSIPARVFACRAARRLGDYAEARQRLKECQDLLKGTNPEVALEDALLRVTMGELSPYETVLRQRLEREPSRAPLILEALAEGYIRMYRVLESLACLNQWLEYEPDNVQALYLRGRAQQQARSWEKAAADYRRAVELDPKRADVRDRLVQCLLELSRFEEALGHLEQLQREQGDSPEFQVRMARCQHGMGQVKTARQTLEALLADHPDNGPALVFLGKIMLSSGLPEEAEPWLRKAVAVLPYDYQARLQLYQALNRQEGKNAEAQQELAQAEKIRERQVKVNEISTRLAVRPHDPALHYEMGMLQMELGNRDLGARWLGSALNEQPDYQPARDALIKYLEEIGDTEKADEVRQYSGGGNR